VSNILNGRAKENIFKDGNRLCFRALITEILKQTMQTGFRSSLLMIQSTTVVYLRSGFPSDTMLTVTLPPFLVKVFLKIRTEVENGKLYSFIPMTLKDKFLQGIGTVLNNTLS